MNLEQSKIETNDLTSGDGTLGGSKPVPKPLIGIG